MSKEYGVSFSLHRCSELDIDPKAVLDSAINNLGFKRFRIMSYWNIHEPQKGKYDFSELDWQIEMINKAGGEISLCLGKRQPRWPECHLPDWAKSDNTEQWEKALMKYIKTVINRYKKYDCITSYQLENEALLKDFGYCKDHDYRRSRLKKEFQLIKSLDSNKPIIMTLSDSSGLPWLGPHADAYGLTIYPFHSNGTGKYIKTKRPPLFFKIRSKMINTLYRKPVFVHELQAEPWLDNGILESPLSTQLIRMNPEIFKSNLEFAEKIDIYPIDLWGLEWWYWLKEKKHNSQMWDTIKAINERQST